MAGAFADLDEREDVEDQMVSGVAATTRDGIFAADAKTTRVFKDTYCRMRRLVETS